MIIKGIGTRDEAPAIDFPMHAPEGVLDLASLPLKVRGETLGALIVGYRAEHHFTTEEETLLSGLAEMAALAGVETRPPPGGRRQLHFRDDTRPGEAGGAGFRGSGGRRAGHPDCGVSQAGAACS